MQNWQCLFPDTFLLPWRDPWGDRHKHARRSDGVRPLSLCKISAKSGRQFRRKCVPNTQTDRRTDRQTGSKLNIPPKENYREISTVTGYTRSVSTKIRPWPHCTAHLQFYARLRLQSLNFVKRRSGHAQKSAGPHGHFTKSISVLRFVRCFEVRPFTGETLLSRWAAALLRVSFSARCRLVICGIKSVRFRRLRVTNFFTVDPKCVYRSRRTSCSFYQCWYNNSVCPSVRPSVTLRYGNETAMVARSC